MINYLCVLNYVDFDIFNMLKKISVLLFSALVLITTGGFKIYSHHCDCCHITEFSLTKIDVCCTSHEMPADCDANKTEMQACCNGKMHIAEKKHSCAADHCCKIESRYFKLKSFFEIKKHFELKGFQVFENLIQIFHTEISIGNFVKKILRLADHSPPVFSQLDFVIFSHSFKIPHL